VADERTANDISVLGIGDQAVVEGFDFLLQARLERGLDDPLADLGAGGGQRTHVVDVQVGQAQSRCARPATWPPSTLCDRKSRNACAVVAKPPGTRTPARPAG
jgi:hypothetical protein